MTDRDDDLRGAGVRNDEILLFQVGDDALVGVRDGDEEPDLVGVDHMVTSHEIRSRQPGRKPEIMFSGFIL